MKKLILSSILVMAGIFAMNAQADSDLVQWGVKAGANFANASGDDVDNPDSRTGFYAGILAEVPITERFSVQPELYYSQQGFKIKNDVFEATEKLDYIHIPVLAKVYLIKGLNLQVGPQIGFNINDELHIDSDIGNVDITPDDSDVNDIDFDVVAGLEYKFDNGLFVNGRYMYGISKIVKNNDAHNSVFQVGLGYMF